MPRHKFQSIKSKGGLEIHLNETKDIHRGLGYKIWRIARVAGLNVTALRKLFNVNAPATIKDWIRIDDAEQAEKRKQANSEVESLK